MSLVLSHEPTSLVAVEDQCAAVEAWAEQCQSVPELRDASNRLAAIDEYLSRTSTEGRARVAAAMRRLEVRIGQLLPPPATHGGDRSSGASPHADLPKQRAVEFRQMAAHPEVVEEVIAQSTDEQPASRRQVVNAIREQRSTTPGPTPPASTPEPTAPQPAAPRRRPWTDAYSDAVAAVERAATTLTNLAGDDRAAKHSEQVIGRTNDLLRAIDALAGNENATRPGSRRGRMA